VGLLKARNCILGPLEKGISIVGSATKKHSYTITCCSSFRDRIEKLAARRQVNVGDLARSVLLMVPYETIVKFADPGEPINDDRETVILKSGSSKGRIWKRKPRLQVRMCPGVDSNLIRRALAMALAMEQGELDIYLEQVKPGMAPTPEVARQAEAEVERLRTIVSALCFDPLPDGIQNREEALHVLGFAPGGKPDDRSVKARFRMLAAIHHPDSPYGNHQRMSQLNAAMDQLRSALY
jgi:hypothetical protein